jgi:hypothetical protein
MSQLIINLPAVKVWVRKEYLRDHQDGHGEFVEGIWVALKSITGRAFYFETYLPEYGAMYDKLPISAFVMRPEVPKPDLPLSDLQFWDAMDYGVRILQKSFIGSMDIELRTKTAGIQKGSYMFTIDNYHPDLNEVDASVSESPEEHKSHNVIELDNGQIALYPNNRMRLFDISLTPSEVSTPDFKVSTQYYSVEHGSSWGRLGDSDEYHWQTKEEKNVKRKRV